MSQQVTSTGFEIHSLEDSTGERRESLEGVQKAFGRVPNLLGVLAEAPAAADAYLALGDLVGRTSFSPTERHVVWFASNWENDCHYCMAAHTAIAKGEKIPADVIEAARTGAPYADPRLEALRSFTRRLVERRGWVDPAEVEDFLAAGFTRQQVLEIVVALAHKVISNYTNHLADTPVDRAFSPFAWTKPESTVPAS